MESGMLRTFAAAAPPIALVLVGVLLVEPPAISPVERLPTLRVLAQPASVQLSADDWRPLDTAGPYVESFEAATLNPGEVYPQRLTLHSLPMQANERVGVIIAPNEYAEFLYLYPVKVTLRVLLDRGEFWVESVQTFEVPVGRPLPVRWRLGRAASEEENWTLLALYSPEVKATQFQLRQLF